MRVHITNLYGISYSCASRIAMNNTVEIAKQMDFHELGFFKYPVETDSDAELNTRLDGIIAGLWHDDVVVFQFPSWNGFTFDEKFCDKVKDYLNTKLILYVHDIVPLMFDKNEDNIRRVVQILNRADVLILPSEKMKELLKEYGLEVSHILYQEVWDYPISEHMEPSAFVRKMFFPGALERFPYIVDWKGKTPVEVFDNGMQACENSNLIVHKVLPSTELVFKLNRGGFGLLWAEGTQKEYYQYNNPFKLGTYLAAGIPVIVQVGTHAAEFVAKHQIGFVVHSLQEADEIVQKLTEEEYGRISKNVEKIAFLVRNGYYTRSVLNEAVKCCLTTV
ncbi:MAG: sugar transferase [Lachnospiraceae bacterium]|nr:sugar transferase [Lachnospiraceae bacterium]